MGWRDWFGGKRKTKVPDALWAQTLTALSFLANLAVDEQKRLKTLVEDFLGEKEFSTAGGLELSDEICVAIAAQGCLPILELGLAAYRGWVGIVVYPDEFVVARRIEDEDGIVHEFDDVLSGEAWEGGPLIISWHDAQMAGSGYNVVIHEFAHKLDMLNGEADGIPALHSGMTSEAWDDVFIPAYEDFCRRVDNGEETDIDPYASDAPAEFFAVISENFFELPAVVNREYPALYALLRSYYRQHPLGRLREPAGFLETTAMPQSTPPSFQSLSGLYEPSAIQQLSDGRFLIVEDEVGHPLSLADIAADGTVRSRALTPRWFEGNDAFWELDDLEGLALDSAGHVYAITSHSRDSDGDEKKARDKLVRFRIDGNRVSEPKVAKGLKAALSAAHPELAVAATIGDVKGGGGLNIEALEITPDRSRLLVGFRSPLVNGRAIIASLENPVAIFEAGESPRISPVLDTFDLDGNGLRGMSYVPSLGGYVLIGGPVARERVQFQLWFWSGRRGEEARQITVPGLTGFEHAEGVSPAVIDGRQQLIIVSDDGSRDDDRHGRFLLLDIAQLQIAA